MELGGNNRDRDGSKKEKSMGSWDRAKESAPGGVAELCVDNIGNMVGYGRVVVAKERDKRQFPSPECMLVPLTSPFIINHFIQVAGDRQATWRSTSGRRVLLFILKY